MAITCKTGDRIEERVPRCPSGRAVEDLIVGPLSYTFPALAAGCYVRAFEMFGNGVDRRRGGVESARIRKSAGPSVWDFRASGRIARRTENKSGVTFVCSGSKSGSGPSLVSLK
jgi:hypothetical protein